MPINISNPKNRDAVVAAEALNPKREIRYTDAKGRPVSTRKLLKTDVLHDLPELLAKKKKLEKVADALVKEDPEIDIESFGMFLTDMSRVYVTKSTPRAPVTRTMTTTSAPSTFAARPRRGGSATSAASGMTTGSEAVSVTVGTGTAAVTGAAATGTSAVGASTSGA